jgi:hypothetical protein
MAVEVKPSALQTSVGSPSHWPLHPPMSVRALVDPTRPTTTLHFSNEREGPSLTFPHTSTLQTSARVLIHLPTSTTTPSTLQMSASIFVDLPAAPSTLRYPNERGSLLSTNRHPSPSKYAGLRRPARNPHHTLRSRTRTESHFDDRLCRRRRGEICHCVSY